MRFRTKVDVANRVDFALAFDAVVLG
jgi:hypothetical protein